MEIDYSLHTELALWSFVLGAFLCAVYDVFRLFRLGRKQNPVILFLMDLLYCMIAAVFVILMFFNLSFGRMRMYSFAFIFLGFLVWRFTVSFAVMSLMRKHIFMVRKLLNSIKMRICSIFTSFAQHIYTIFYCRKLLNQAKHGFGILKRKEFKNESQEAGTN